MEKSSEQVSREFRVHQREMRLAAKKTREAAKTPFLPEWLAEFLHGKKAFAAQGFTQERLEALANEAGYRTWRVYQHSLEHQEKALRLFVQDPFFQSLWQELRQADESAGTFDYSPAHGGMPATILRTVENWHRLPKFTAAELASHRRKIVRAADALLLLLGQVTPSEPYADEYSAIIVRDPDRLNRVAAAIDNLNHYRGAVKTNYVETLADYEKMNLVRTLVEGAAGVTVVAAVRGLRNRCAADPMPSLAPRKIRAKEAMKTYFIAAVAGATMFHRLRNQLVADVVARLTDTDCTADDVRKTLAQVEARSRRIHGVEDSASSSKRNVPRGKPGK